MKIQNNVAANGGMEIRMSGYLYSLAAAAVLIALVCAIVPESGAQHAKLLCSLCMVALLFAPVMSLLGALEQGAWEIPEAFSICKSGIDTVEKL